MGPTHRSCTHPESPCRHLCVRVSLVDPRAHQSLFYSQRASDQGHEKPVLLVVPVVLHLKVLTSSRTVSRAMGSVLPSAFQRSQSAIQSSELVRRKRPPRTTSMFRPKKALGLGTLISSYILRYLGSIHRPSRRAGEGGIHLRKRAGDVAACSSCVRERSS